MTAALEVMWSLDGSPVEDLAREEAMLEAAASGRAVLALSSWAGPVVVIGYAQKADDIRLDWCRGQGIPVLRRITGGTGVIHQGDLGVALALPATHPWAGAIVGLYDLFLDALQEGLEAVGSEVERKAVPERPGRQRSPICFEDQSSDTLLVAGRKAVGCAQARRKRAVLIHAAVLLGLDAELYGAVFGVASERVAAGLAPAVEGVPARRVGEAIAEAVAGSLGARGTTTPPLVPTPEVVARWELRRWSPIAEA